MLVQADGHNQGRRAARRGVRSPAAARAATAARNALKIFGEEYGMAAVTAWLDDRGLHWWSVMRARRC
jgi:hypothetical protein